MPRFIEQYFENIQKAVKECRAAEGKENLLHILKFIEDHAESAIKQLSEEACCLAEPVEPRNVNCLADFRCPKCKSLGPFQALSSKPGFVNCDCGFSGTSRDFKVVE